jgi:hypothetical protein
MDRRRGLVLAALVVAIGIVATLVALPGAAG